jgi:NAD(P)-dependent dehydrogenase (short-subunit alcohol dehydrogenase family)
MATSQWGSPQGCWLRRAERQFCQFVARDRCENLARPYVIKSQHADGVGDRRRCRIGSRTPPLTIDDLLQLPPGGYGESKAVLNAFTRLLAREWPRRAVNAASPGWVRTDMGGAGAPRSLDQGAASVLFCCRLRAGGPSGRVFEDGVEVGF